MSENNKQQILLEAGTNELEIIEFKIGNEYYGINVAKVREIIRANIGIVPVPDSHESVAGVVNLRGRITPVVTLAKQLKIDVDYDPKASRIIVTEFNKLQAGFWVNEVTRIHRISWKDVGAPSGLVNSKMGYAVGVIKIEDRILFLLDFEKIASIINPEAGLEGVADAKPKSTNQVDRSTKQIFIAEDSAYIRQLLVDYVSTAGYKVKAFTDGEKAWNAFQDEVKSEGFKDVSDFCNLLITDIEMPQMDGLHLISKVRAEKDLKDLPCVVFSSMITDELADKCRKVGANGQLTKPEIDLLVETVDKLCL